jgi:SWI/SNF-related matrix-associated actin-dependent regulator 1 of chromatin subfamily A
MFGALGKAVTTKATKATAGSAQAMFTTLQTHGGTQPSDRTPAIAGTGKRTMATKPSPADTGMYSALASVGSKKPKPVSIGKAPSPPFPIPDPLPLLPEEEVRRYIADSTWEMMRLHQRVGVVWLVSNRSGILGHEMGLGKTIMGTVYSQYCISRGEIPILIVCPAGGVMDGWKNEILKVIKCKPEHICVYQGTTQMAGEPFVIVSYDTAVNRAQELRQRGFKLVILDESQHLKNPKSERFMVLAPLVRSIQRRVLLTATPMDRPRDMWAQLDLITPGRYAQYPFLERYCSPTQVKLRGGRTVTEYKGSCNEPELHRLLQTVMVRELKKDAEPLPPMTRIRRYLWYEAAQAEEGAGGEDEALPDPSDAPVTSERIKKLLGLDGKKGGKRKRSSAVDDGDGGSFGADDVMPSKSVSASLFKDEEFATLCTTVMEYKIPLVQRYLRHRIGQLLPDEKVLIFAHNEEMLDAIQSTVQAMGLKTARIDGKVAPKKRGPIVEVIQKDENTRVAVLSIMACKTGLTLTRATHAWFLQVLPVAEAHVQAEARLHRIGQTKPVTVEYWMLAQSIEEQMFWLCYRKFKTQSKIMDGVERTLGSSEYDATVMPDGSCELGKPEQAKATVRRRQQALELEETATEVTG